MNNTQFKKTKMLTSYREGFYSPPYPYSFRVRGLPSRELYVYCPKCGPHNRIKHVFPKFHAGCGICKGYGYIDSYGTYNGTDLCSCLTDGKGIYSKRKYRMR